MQMGSRNLPGASPHCSPSVSVMEQLKKLFGGHVALAGMESGGAQSTNRAGPVAAERDYRNARVRVL